MIVHACNANTQETEEGELQFLASLGDTARLCLKKDLIKTPKWNISIIISKINFSILGKSPDAINSRQDSTWSALQGYFGCQMGKFSKFSDESHNWRKCVCSFI